MSDTQKINAVSHPLSTEKSLRLMESQNKLIFSVHKQATKHDIKNEIEQLFNAKVTNVNTYVTIKGEKRAYVTFSPETPAIEIATTLGLM